MTIAFFNNKGGVGKTTLVYHLSYMFAELGHRVLAVDLDPQSNLTSMFLDDYSLEEIFNYNQVDKTILQAVNPLLKGIGDIQAIKTEKVSGKIDLIVGDLGLSTYEDKLSDAWVRCSDGDEAAFRIVSAFYRTISHSARKRNSEVILIDVGPNLGAINRATMIAADFVVMPVVPDLFSVQGLKNLGPALRDWRNKWKERLTKNPEPLLELPKGQMKPLGYVILQHNVRSSRPVKAYLKWASKLPRVFREFVLKQKEEIVNVSVENDKYCLGLLKHYQSLMPMAMEARKPIFLLKPADGAIGAHLQAVYNCYEDFRNLATKILEKTNI